jgi:prophage antirepressor-like protein
MRVENWNGHSIRFVERDGEWWAVAKDLCETLDIELTGHTFEDFPNDECSRYSIPVSSEKSKARKMQKMLIINEFGIYRLIFASRKPEAEAFLKWVFQVIKELRKSLGLSEYEAFRMMDKEHQKAAMHKLFEGLREPIKVDYKGEHHNGQGGVHHARLQKAGEEAGHGRGNVTGPGAYLSRHGRAYDA